MYLSMGHTMWGWPLPSFLAENHIAMGLIELLLTAAVMVINQTLFYKRLPESLHGAHRIWTRW